MDKLPKELQAQVSEAVILEKEFAEKLRAVKDAEVRVKEFWNRIEAAMIEHDVKRISSKDYGQDWGTLTIAERLSWLTTDELPKKFTKTVVDTKKLSDTFKLEGKAPKGAVPTYNKYLMKRIKS